MAQFVWENLFKSNSQELSIRQALKGNFLFQDLTTSELRLLEKIVNIRQYLPGEPVFQQGERGVGMYLILDGAVDIFTEKSNLIHQSPSDREQGLESKQDKPEKNFVVQLKTGDFFGELALVEQDARRTATSIANIPTTLIGFFKPDLIEVVERNPTAGVKILMRLGEVLGTRLHQTTRRLSELRDQA